MVPDLAVVRLGWGQSHSRRDRRTKEGNMRLGAFVFMACTCLLPTIAAAQVNNYMGGNSQPSETVIRPAATVAWRNYVTVPDGPCGYPMPVEADCYNACRP